MKTATIASPALPDFRPLLPINEQKQTLQIHRMADQPLSDGSARTVVQTAVNDPATWDEAWFGNYE